MLMAGASRRATVSPRNPARCVWIIPPSRTGASPASSARGSQSACRWPAQPSRKEANRLPDAAEVVHGTCVALGQRGALLRGPSGCGKSDLALRFLFLARRGPAARDAPALVADDQVVLTRDGGRLLAAAPESISGKLEVRGVGIVGVKTLAQCELALVADLVRPDEVERLPAMPTPLTSS